MVSFSGPPNAAARTQARMLTEDLNALNKLFDVTL